MNGPTPADVLAALRRILRRRGVRYRALARSLSMSESGVKKLLTSDDCSLSRVMQICDALDVDVEDVLAAARHGDPEPVPLTAAQVRHFERRPRDLWFLWALGEAGWDPEELGRRSGTTAAARRRVLSRLDRLGLIEHHADGRVTPRARGWQWRLPAALGPTVMDPLHDRVIASAREALAEGSPDRANARLGMGRFRLRGDSVRDLAAALEAVLIEFTERGRRERAVHGDASLVPVAALTALAPFDLARVLAAPG